MDRQEYREIVNEIKTGYARRDYDRVIMFARELQPRKIKELSVLEIIASSYERVGKPGLAKATLEVAYDRTGNSKSMAARLVMLSLKLKDIDGAVAYYEEFCRIAPHDNQRFLLKYYIADFGGLSKKDKIKILEDYTSKELDEKWLFELAKLYHEAGMGNKCADTCDELILWFANGDYLKRALELKFAHKSLTPEQQEMYENIMSEYFENGNSKSFDAKEAIKAAKLENEAEEFANELLGIKQEEEEACEEEKISDTKPIYAQHDEKISEYEPAMAETKKLSLHIPESFEAEQPEQETVQNEDLQNAEPLDYFARKALREAEEARKAEEEQRAAQEAQKAAEEAAKAQAAKALEEAGQVEEEPVVYADKKAQREAEIKLDDEPGETPDLTTFYERKKVEIKDDGLGLSLDILREDKGQIQGQFSIDQLFKTYANNIEHNEASKDAVEKIEAERLKQIHDAVGGIEPAVPVFDEDFDDNTADAETKDNETAQADDGIEIVPVGYEAQTEEAQTEKLPDETAQTEELTEEREDEGIEIAALKLSVEIAEPAEVKTEVTEETAEAPVTEETNETQISDDEVTEEDMGKSQEEENEEIAGLGDFLAGVLGKEGAVAEEKLNIEAETEPKVTDEQAKAVHEAGLDDLDDIFAGIFGDDKAEENKAEEVKTLQPENKETEDIKEAVHEKREEIIEPKSPEKESITETLAVEEKDDDADKVFVEEEILDFDEADEAGETEADTVLNEADEAETDEALNEESAVEAEPDETVNLEAEKSDEDVEDLGKFLSEEYVAKLEAAEPEPELELVETDAAEAEAYESAEPEKEESETEEHVSEEPEIEEKAQPVYDEAEADNYEPDGESETNEALENAKTEAAIENYIETPVEPEAEPAEEPEDNETNVSEALENEMPDEAEYAETADIPEEYEPLKGDTQQIKRPYRYVLDNDLREELAEFLLVENMDEDITDVINNIIICRQSGDESGGNLIVTGDAKTGKTFLAISIIKAVTKELGHGTGRVAKVQAESINGKNIEKVFKKIEGNDLIIENVGDLNDEAIEGIIRAIENGTAKNMVVLESNVLAIETIVNNHPEIEKLFKNRIDVGELTISQWADVACDYAERKGYVVNDMALLALHAKIDELNIPTARFGYDNIVYIMEMAIKKADKRNTGRLFAAFKKGDGSLKELTESDFM